MKYKITNKTFSPLQLSGIGIIPARGSIMVNQISKELKILEKNIPPALGNMTPDLET